MTNQPAPATTLMACPNCGSSEAFATVEHMEALAFATIRRSPDGTPDINYAGESEMLWDTQTWDTGELICRDCGEISISFDDIVPATDGAS